MKPIEILHFNLLKDCDLRAIAAVAENGIIGANNRIPWNIPEELQFFKNMTSGHSVLMGRKTFQSIGKPLQNRKNIILSKSGFTAEGTITINSPEQISSLSGIIWVCGGVEVYKALLPSCRELYISTVLGHYHGDAIFPEYRSQFFSKEIILKHGKFYVTRFINKNYDENI